MSMNQTPMSERVHIGFFGKRNAGKSSVMNAVTGQDLAVVSEVKGTTTDPVYKSMELLPLGPVVMMDTPGIDDEGELGSLRVKKSYQVLNKTDAAVLVIDGTVGASEEDRTLLDRIRKKNIPFTGGVNSPYIWFQCPNGMESWEFFDYLLTNAEVVGTPGAGFGENGKNYFRLTSFGVHEKTAEAMERFDRLF